MLLQRIAKITGLSEAYVARIISTASHRYRTYSIPKRKGGFRTIDHPSRHLKFLQRWLVRTVFSKLPVHNSVYSYKEDVSIRDHARLHVGTRYTLRIDFRNFFPSIKSADVRRLIKIHQDRFGFRLAVYDIASISAISCKDDKLTIGAPTSPAISNAIMYSFDEYWSQKCNQMKIVYSRYADDIYFSTNQPGLLKQILSDLKEDLRRRKSPRLKLNDAKTVFTSRKRKRVITGLIITPDRKISLGRDRKRQIRTLVFLYAQGRLNSEQVKSLQGLLAFAKSVEPNIIGRLRNKYGNDTVDRIFEFS